MRLPRLQLSRLRSRRAPFRQATERVEILSLLKKTNMPRSVTACCELPLVTFILGRICCPIRISANSDNIMHQQRPASCKHKAAHGVFSRDAFHRANSTCTRSRFEESDTGEKILFAICRAKAVCMTISHAASPLPPCTIGHLRGTHDSPQAAPMQVKAGKHALPRNVPF